MVCFPPHLPSTFFNGCLTSLPGAFFGTTFAHLFFQTYRELMPAPFWKQPSSSGSMSPSRSPRSITGSNSSQQAPFVNPNPHGGQKRAAGKVYLPRIYGFKVSEKAKSGPRMQWMRLRPESPEDLDEVDWRGRWIDDEEDQYDDGIDGEAEEDRRMEDFDPVRRTFFYCTMIIIDIWNRTMLMMTTTTTMRRKKRKKKRKWRVLEEAATTLRLRQMIQLINRWYGRWQQAPVSLLVV